MNYLLKEINIESDLEATRYEDGLLNKNKFTQETSSSNQKLDNLFDFFVNFASVL